MLKDPKRITLKGSDAMIKWDLFLGCKDDLSANQSIWYTTLTIWRIKKSHSLYAGKAFYRLQYPLMIFKKTQVSSPPSLLSQHSKGRIWQAHS